MLRPRTSFIASRLTVAAFACFGLLAFAPAAFATSINVDFKFASAPVPSSAFGAASGQAGTWNGIFTHLL
jgi:hypothetical protein